MDDLLFALIAMLVIVGPQLVNWLIASQQKKKEQRDMAVQEAVVLEDLESNASQSVANERHFAEIVIPPEELESSRSFEVRSASSLSPPQKNDSLLPLDTTAQLVAPLFTPEGMANAIIVSEIIRRPEERW